jgi:hypothetical protein
MKTFLFPIMIVGFVAVLGSWFLLGEIINNSYATLSIRFSHSFFNVFTLVPLSIIGLGVAIIFWGIFLREFNKGVRLEITVFSILVMLVGVSVFGFYLLD